MLSLLKIFEEIESMESLFTSQWSSWTSVSRKASSASHVQSWTSLPPTRNTLLIISSCNLKSYIILYQIISIKYITHMIYIIYIINITYNTETSYSPRPTCIHSLKFWSPVPPSFGVPQMSITLQLSNIWAVILILIELDMMFMVMG